MLSLLIPNTSFLHIITILTVASLMGCKDDVNIPNNEDQPIVPPPTRTEVKVTGNVTQALPINTAINTPYPVAFRFTNESKKDATKLTLMVPNVEGFTETRNSCNQTLPAKGNCEYIGVMESTTPEQVRIFVTLSYAEGKEEVELETSSTSSEVAVNGNNPQALPSRIVINTPYPVTYTYTNETSLDATGVSTLVSTSSGTFNEINNSCGPRLDAHQSCQLEGTIVSSTPDTLTLSATFSYAQGGDIVLETTTTSSEVAVTSNIEGVPIHTAINTEYPVTFKYTNPSDVSVTDMRFTPSVNAGELNLTSDNCGSALAARDSCEILGRLVTPAARQQLTLSANLEYNQAISPSHKQVRTWATPYTEIPTVTVSSPVNKRTVFAISDYMALADSALSTSFLIHPSLQQASVLSFVENEVWKHRTPTELQLDVSGQVVTLEFTSHRPNCGVFTAINAAAECRNAPQRVVKLTLSASEFNKLPSGSHTVNLTFSHKRWHSWAAGYQHMVKLPITFIKS
ncbi:hypothetical protein L1D54_23865 [Vibrio brasiliensis]|uniref:hypothetical protein n=1 Tax=Vibrio brasiliensis TaxID=170652 RepID=UPI001EFC7330|nr:hypothetical protein [Vibrio brasiliensis]MCG9753478.1 hypothetical protein [Vibrio brasiliensis]